MEFKTTTNTATHTENKTSGGIENVAKSARTLLRSLSGLSTTSLKMIERELAVAISVSEQIRDGLVTPLALESTRKKEVVNQFRADAHRAVDMAIDAGGLVLNIGLDFLDKFAEPNR